MRGGMMPGADGERPEKVFGENGGRGGKMDMTPPDGEAGATPPDRKNGMGEFGSIKENT